MTCHHSGACTDQVAYDLVSTHADYARGGTVGHTGVLFDLPYEDLSTVWRRFTDLDADARNDVTAHLNGMLGRLIGLCQQAGVEPSTIVDAIVADLDGNPGPDVDEPVTDEMALTLGIFAINTWMDPRASSRADIEVLERRAREITHALAALREATRCN